MWVTLSKRSKVMAKRVKKINTDKLLNQATKSRERQIKKKTPKPGIYETRRNEILKLGEKALKNLSDIERTRDYYRKKGYNIEHEEWVDNAKANINRIMSKPKPNKKDLEMMRDMSQARYFDYIKINNLEYKKLRPKAKKLTKKVQKVLEEAKDLYPENIKTNEYTPYLESLVMDLKNEPEVASASDVSDFYSISDEYDPKKEEELFRNIDITSLPYAEDIETIAEALEQKLHDEQIRVQQLKDNAANKSYVSNTKSINNLDAYTMYTLENVMNSSAAWHICKRNTHDSDETKDNWNTLYRYVRLALDNDFEVFDKVITMIENEADLDNIINYIDHEIYDMM